MAGRDCVICEKSQIPIPLEKLVPELTMSDLSNFKIAYEDLEVLEKIGEGGFGSVFKGRLRNDLVAIKQLIVNPLEEFSLDSFREFWREVFLLNTLAHPCIVALKAVSSNPCCMVMEFMPSGNLYSYLQSRTELSWPVRLKIASNIADAMRFLHSYQPKICHRDLKTPNILMAVKDPYASVEVVCKVSDFGESRFVATSGQGRENLANPLWLAPEVMRGGEYTEKCDVYSFGIMLWEILTLKEPYSEYPVAKSTFMSHLEDAIIGGLRPTIPKSCPAEYRFLIESAWADDPSKRPGFDTIYSQLAKMRTVKNTFGKKL